MTTPSTNNSNNSKLKEIKDIKDIKDFKISNKKNDINNNNINKYIKKLNVKSYQQKLKELKNDNFAAKKEHYGNIYERQKKEEKLKDINLNKFFEKTKSRDIFKSTDSKYKSVSFNNKFENLSNNTVKHTLIIP